jgi:hypothetical protein
MTDLFGQAPAHASPSAPRAKEQVQPTNVTYGRIGSVSSASAALASSLAKMLNKRLDGAGSTLFAMTWRRRVTPRGRPYFQLAASARLISDKDCGSWPTARSTDGDKNVRTAAGSLREIERKGDPQDLNQAAHLASWPTATVHDAERGGQAKRAMRETRHGSNLQDFAMLASWPTPTRDEAGGTPEQFLARKEKLDGKCGVSLTALNLVAQTASWPTPTSQDAASSRAAGYSTQSGRHSGTTLTDAATVALASWATPRVAATRTGTSAMNRQDSMSALSLEQQAEAAAGIVPREIRNLRLEMQARLGFGPTSNGSHAATEKPGQLNPDFTRWLLGYRAEHLSCAPTEMPSSRKSRRPSSERS